LKVWVPKAEAGYYALQQLHAAHDAQDAERRDAAERALPPAAGSDQSAKPRARALGNPFRGSRHRRDLVNQAVAKMTKAANLLAPVTHVPSAAANAFTNTINMGTSGISTTAGSLSNAMAKGVNATLRAGVETSTVAARIMSNTTISAQRARVMRFMKPLAASPVNVS